MTLPRRTMNALLSTEAGAGATERLLSPDAWAPGGTYVMMNDMTERGAGTRDDAASPWQFGFGGPRALGGKKSLFCLPSTGPVSDDLQTASSSSNFAVTGRKHRKKAKGYRGGQATSSVAVLQKKRDLPQTNRQGLLARPRVGKFRDRESNPGLPRDRRGY